MTVSKLKHLYLIDGSGFIFRAFHALPPMTRHDGTPINAVLGFSNMLFKLLKDLDDNERPSHLACIFDRARKTFRNDIYPDYKAHRPPAPDDLVPQFPIIHEAVKAFNVPAIDRDGFEADDIIATYARDAEKQGFKVTIVSSDKDLMQLVGDKITMFDSMKNKHIGPDEVFEKFGVGPEKVIEIQALAGDSSDNVPGVPGVGVKTAALLINEYGDLDSLLARAGEIKQNKRREKLIEFADMARISRELVTLSTDVPDLPEIATLAVQDIDAENILPFLEEQGFRSLQVKVLSHMSDYDIPSNVLANIPANIMVPEVISSEDIAYETVTTMDQLNRWIRDIKRSFQVAIDTETTSLNAMRAELVGISLSILPGKACYIPLSHRTVTSGEFDFGDSKAPEQLPMDQVLAALKPILEDPVILKIGQNIKYDYLILAKHGIEISPLDDTMLLSYALDAGSHHHGMDELAKLHLNHDCIPFKEICGTGKNKITFDQVAVAAATDYAAEDADITGRLHRLLKPRLADEGMTTVYETLDRPLVPVIAAMEKEGILVDRQMLSRLSNDFAERLSVLEKEIHGLAGHEFNIGSPKQLGEILFGEMGLPGAKKNKSGGYSTNVDVMEGLANAGHEFPARVLDWRQLAKLKSTYTDALQNDINQDTGRIHTSYSLASTTTGRLSSNDPNLQNIPIRTEEGRKIRQAFIPKAGHKFLAADYSQIELRLLAHIADLGSLKQAFRDGVDIHTMTASEVFGVPIDGMDPAVRRQAKAINFGIIYGISAFGLARQLGIGNAEAKQFIETYFERFPGIRTYMEETKDFCRRHGYVETIFGRRCHIASINDKNGMQRAFGERAAINAPIQGAAADVIKRAMTHMGPALGKAGLGAKMLLQVHDELVFEVPEDQMDQTIPLVKAVMEKAALPALEISVPLTVDCGVGDNWDEAH
ncbi:DNA polymerase I [hydrothermal vent metagenome]|uniref:DNA-directed DNA polymerase n=1 Tax=hydrothermal vent metagenome TaxID=652676 RepID=A0A3B1BTQ6_9ZZZZ